MTQRWELSGPETKACCAALYSSDWARLLLGESFHPGGLALTERLGRLLGLGPEARVLDVAAGTGASALFLAERFGCTVVGIDYSAELVRQANERAGARALAHLLRFEQGDAEQLPLADASFDAIICECAFCTFPDKGAAAREFRRVLGPGGKVGVADLTRTDPLPDEFRTLLAWISCLGAALPVADYVDILEGAGFTVPLVEPHDEALRQIVQSVKAKLFGAELLSRLGKLALPSSDLQQAKAMAQAAARAVEQGRLGYTLIVAAQPHAVRTRRADTV